MEYQKKIIWAKQNQVTDCDSYDMCLSHHPITVEMNMGSHHTNKLVLF